MLNKALIGAQRTGKSERYQNWCSAGDRNPVCRDIGRREARFPKTWTASRWFHFGMSGCDIWIFVVLYNLNVICALEAFNELQVSKIKGTGPIVLLIKERYDGLYFIRTLKNLDPSNKNLLYKMANGFNIKCWSIKNTSTRPKNKTHAAIGLI